MPTLALIGWLNFASSAGLAVLVGRHAVERRLARSYVLLNAAIAAWAIAFALWQGAENPDSGYRLLQAVFLPGIWINQLFLLFTFDFLKITGKARRLLWVTGVVKAGFSVLLLSGFMFYAVEPRAGLGFWPLIGPAFWPYMLAWHAEIAYGFFVAVPALRTLPPERRARLKFFILGATVGYAGGIATWPLCVGVYFPPHVCALVGVHCFVMAYAIVRHGMIDVRVVVRRTLLYSLLTLSLTLFYWILNYVALSVLQSTLADRPIATALFCAVITSVAFQPLRDRIQRWIDRRFPRESLDPHLLREATSQFVHEIKRPLARISLPAQLALQDLGRLRANPSLHEAVLPKTMALLEQIVRESMEAGDTMEALRELAADRTVSRTEVDLHRLITQVIASEQPRLDRFGIHMTLSEANWTVVSGNAQQLRIAFQNLLKNAIDALAESPAPRLITIEPVLTDAFLAVRIQDNGPGISPEHRNRIFEAYFTTKGASGTGVGLFLAREILRRHGGDLNVSESSNAGAVFTATLPRSAA